MTILETHSFVPYRGRSNARLAAVQVLFQWEKNQEPLPTLLRQYTQERAQSLGDESGDLLLAPADLDYMKRLVETATQRLDDIDALISQCLSSDWTISRIESVIRAILRIGCGELLEERSVDGPVIINEYLDVAHAFFDGKEVKFVNSVLDQLSKKIRGS